MNLHVDNAGSQYQNGPMASVVSGFIPAYGNEIGLDSLALDDGGICALAFDGKINVNIVFREAQDQLFYVSRLGGLPAENPEEFYKNLLKANAFGSETAGAAIGIDEGDGTVVLSYVLISSTLSYDLFKVTLGNFVDLAEVWINKLEGSDWSSDTFNSSGSGGTESRISEPVGVTGLDPGQFIRI
jgi:hypothetical protein